MRITCLSDGEPLRYGILKEGSSRIVIPKGNPLLSGIEPDGHIVEFKEVRFLSPMIPRPKVIDIGTSFGEEVRVPGSSEPEMMPSIFMKTNTSVIDLGDPIVLLKWGQDTIYEGELAVIIKSLAEDASLDEVDRVIPGYTLCSDVTARDVIDDGL